MLNSITVFLLFFITGIYSQTNENSVATTPPVLKHHSIYAEIGGNSGIYSLNYDYTLSTSEESQIAFGTGFGFYSIHSDGLSSGSKN